MGRVSLTLTLDELPLHDANRFWGKRQVSSTEKLKILCVTGGVPRYLEEIRPDQTAERNIKRMCFSPQGLLFSEFDKVFTDVFERRSEKLKSIVRALSGPSLEPGELCEALAVKPTGALSDQLSILVASGMVSRDFAWSTSGKKTALSKYRIRDNYLRFYLRYIDRHSEKIQSGLYRMAQLENLIQWHTIIGLQFENLILNNLTSIIRYLDISPESVVSAAPYFQRETKRSKACQVDLLIQTRNTLYVCEMKFRNRIKGSVAKEVLAKSEKILNRTKFSIRPVLIYDGQLSPSIEKSDVFCHLIPASRLLFGS